MYACTLVCSCWCALSKLCACSRTLCAHVCMRKRAFMQVCLCACVHALVVCVYECICAHIVCICVWLCVRDCVRVDAYVCKGGRRGEGYEGMREVRCAWMHLPAQIFSSGARVHTQERYQPQRPTYLDPESLLSESTVDPYVPLRWGHLISIPLLYNIFIGHGMATHAADW